MLGCTNPDLISSGSTFVKESLYSLLVKIENGKSHFLTNKNTMAGEIFKLSKLHPEETFTGEWCWDEDYYDCILHLFECKNGEFKELGIKPGYGFFYPSTIPVNKDEQLAFQTHVIEYLNRLDKVVENDGHFTYDKLNNKKDKCGYESYITITYENELYKWTATRKNLTFIEVSIEEKLPKIDSLKDNESITSIDENSENDELPF
jgi:hypothetical protein